MKVMFGSFSALTVLGGGVKVQVNALARELREFGIEVEFFDPWHEYDLKQFDLFHLFSAHVGTYHLGRAMKTLGMKLVVSPVFFSRHPARRVRSLVAVAERLRRRGGFWTEHMFCKELCGMADMVLPNTQAEADLVADAFFVPRSKMSILPNGVEERFLSATPDAFVDKYGLRDFILYSGHIGWGRKNVLPFLKAAGRLGHPTVVIGEVIGNDYGRKCMALVKQHSHITHIPVLSADSDLLASAYAACDTLVQPAHYETPGLAALEAGLAGAKVCTTKYGGTVEYFADHATYLDPQSERSIEDALRESVGKPKTSSLRDRIRTNYLWGEAASILAGSYKRLLAGRP